VLRGVTGISFTWFDLKDVVRHPLVARVLDASAVYEGRSPPDGDASGG